MIVQLRGKLIEKSPPWIVIDIMGVGYGLQVPMSSFYGLPNLNQEVMLLTEQVIREDAHLLFGFLTAAERALFRAFNKVSGVGPKVALALLSGMQPDALKQAIKNADIDMLKKIPGVGPKTAQRIVVELQDKKQALEMSSILGEGSNILIDQSSPTYQAIQALISLGYKNKEAEQAIQKIKDTVKDKVLACEEMIKLALQGLAKV